MIKPLFHLLHPVVMLVSANRLLDPQLALLSVWYSGPDLRLDPRTTPAAWVYQCRSKSAALV